ncbi:MAG: GGDEF domain-containing protein [Phycisphaerae bacterium]|nr:GGDEF domain-containing protein [Phycisphaerae bacterium]MDD5381019.1 GGDEF domain-containing protein [Phycisphaerae bacterium]
MKTADMPDSAGADTRRLLLVGDINEAFVDADAIRRSACEIQASIPDAIKAAAKNNFAAIAVVMSGVSVKLVSALKTLREVNSRAKIILLVQMYEELAAMQLVNSVRNGVTLADDYLICPVQTNRFYEVVFPAGDRGGNGSDVPVTIDAIGERVRQLEKLATEDELTGLKNRRYIWEFSRQIIERARGENGRVTLLIFDIDNFKHYNDVYGHSAGDEVLKQAAVLMRRCCRGHDVVGRIGGDEFAVVFWNRLSSEDEVQKSETGEQKTENRRQMPADHPKEAIFIAKRFRKGLGKAELHLLGPEGKGVLTISGGLASFPRDGATTDELFEQADRALLDAKRSGKNKIYLVGGPKEDIAEVE